VGGNGNPRGGGKFRVERRRLVGWGVGVPTEMAWKPAAAAVTSRQRVLLCMLKNVSKFERVCWASGR